MIKKKEKDILAANIGIPRMLPSIWSSAKFIAYFITEKREEWGKTSVVNSPFKSFLSTSTLFFCLFFHNLKVPINLANILTHDSPRNWIWCAETVPCTRYNFSRQRKFTNYSASIFLNPDYHYTNVQFVEGCLQEKVVHTLCFSKFCAAAMELRHLHCWCNWSNSSSSQEDLQKRQIKKR